MKKIYLLALLYTLIFSANAQTTPCNNGCIIGPDLVYIDKICSGLVMGYYINAGTGLPVPVSEIADVVFVWVNYHILTCNGVSTIQIDGTVLFDNRFTPTNLLFGPNGETVTITSPPIVCIFPNPLTNVEQLQKDAIAHLIVQLGLPEAGKIIFPGSCRSLVGLSWPNGAFITLPGEYGTTKIIDLTNAITYANIACNDVCCVIEYKYKIISTINWETNFTYVPSPAIPLNNGECESSPMPNYNVATNQLTAMVLDPITNTNIVVYGTVVSQKPCKLICNNYTPPLCSQSFTTDVEEKTKPNIPLEFSAFPTLANSFVKFICNYSIKKVVVYDIKGNRISNITELENNELNTTELKNGMYFIQVYISNTDVRTIKIIKE